MTTLSDSVLKISEIMMKIIYLQCDLTCQGRCLADFEKVVFSSHLTELCIKKKKRGLLLQQFASGFISYRVSVVIRFLVRFRPRIAYSVMSSFEVKNYDSVDK